MLARLREWRESVDATTVIYVTATAILLVLALRQGSNVAIEGLLTAWGILRRNLALLVLGIVLAGLVHVLVPRDLVTEWLGAEAGVTGIFIGCVAGGLMPGSPYTAFPMVASLYHAGASLGAVVGFVSGWALWSVSRLPVEIALIEPRPALIRYGVTFIVPPLAGLLADVVDRLA